MLPYYNMADYEWDEEKNLENQEKHGVSFERAKKAFLDTNRIILKDRTHSTPTEIRYYCIGLVGRRVCTVRFTHREGKIRIFGAGFWRAEREIYERKTKNR